MLLWRCSSLQPPPSRPLWSRDLKKLKSSCSIKSVPRRTEIVSQDLCYSRNVSHYSLSSGPQITMDLRNLSFLLTCLSFKSFLLLSLPSLIHQMFIGLLLSTVSDLQNKSDVIALFFPPFQQNVSQRVVMEVCVLDPTSASVRKDILVLSVNKWTETSAEWPGQVFLIRSLT